MLVTNGMWLMHVNFSHLEMPHRCAFHGEEKFLLHDRFANSTIGNLLPTAKDSLDEVVSGGSKYFDQLFNKTVSGCRSEGEKNCESYVYTNGEEMTIGQKTMITDFNLVCGKRHLQVLAKQIVFIGFTIGTLGVTLADKLGRKPLIVFCVISEVVFGLTTALATNMYIVNIEKCLRCLKINF